LDKQTVQVKIDLTQAVQEYLELPVIKVDREDTAIISTEQLHRAADINSSNDTGGLQAIPFV